MRNRHCNTTTHSDWGRCSGRGIGGSGAGGSTGGTATITGYLGTSTDLVIPAEIVDAAVSCPVTAIALPESLLSLGGQAFEANAITSLVLGSNLTSPGFTTNLSTVVFEGNAPTMLGNGSVPAGPLGIGAGKIVYYYQGATGFTNPWRGYTTQMLSSANASFMVTPGVPVIADGTAAYTATATVLNTMGDPVPGVTVDFAPQAGLSLSAVSCVTDANGTCAVLASSSAPGSFTLGASLGLDGIDTPASLVFEAAESGGEDSDPTGVLAITGGAAAPSR